MGTDTKDRIIQEAQQLFAQHSYAETSLAMIAEAAGIEKASLYYFFKNKEDLYYALVEEMIDQVVALHDEAPKNPSAKTFEQYLTNLFQLAADHGRILSAHGTLGKEKPEHILKKMQQVEAVVQETCTAHGVENTEHATRLVLDVAHAYAKTACMEQEVQDPSAYASYITNLLIAA